VEDVLSLACKVFIFDTLQKEHNVFEDLPVFAPRHILSGCSVYFSSSICVL